MLKVVELPLGEPADRLLKQIRRAQALFPDLERAGAKKKGIPTTKARSEFSRCMNRFIVEKRNAPSLRPA